MCHEGPAAPEDPTGAGPRGVRPKVLVQSLERGIAVLTAFGPDHPTMNLTEVAKHCGLPRPRRAASCTPLSTSAMSHAPDGSTSSRHGS